MANDTNGVNLIRLPWWFKAFFTEWFPTALAVYLLLTIFGVLPSPILKQHTQLVEAVSQHRAETNADVRELVRIARQTCWNVARSGSERRGCDALVGTHLASD